MDVVPCSQVQLLRVPARPGGAGLPADHYGETLVAPRPVTDGGAVPLRVGSTYDDEMLQAVRYASVDDARAALAQRTGGDRPAAILFTDADGNLRPQRLWQVSRDGLDAYHPGVLGEKVVLTSDPAAMGIVDGQTFLPVAAAPPARGALELAERDLQGWRRV
jgi:hypothetical protein